MTQTTTRGDRLREAREGFGQENKSEFARQIEVRPETLWRFEANKLQPSAEVLVRVARVTGWSLIYLVEGSGPPKVEPPKAEPHAAA